MKNVEFNRTNVVNKYLCNYNDLCLEFVKICLLNVKGFRELHSSLPLCSE